MEDPSFSIWVHVVPLLGTICRPPKLSPSHIADLFEIILMIKVLYGQSERVIALLRFHQDDTA